MKLYKFDYKGTIGNNVITVPTDSQFLIGIGNGDASSTAQLFDGTTEILPEDDKIGEYTCFRMETQGTQFRKPYKAVINGNNIDLYIICKKMSVAYRDETGLTSTEAVQAVKDSGEFVGKDELGQYTIVPLIEGGGEHTLDLTPDNAYETERIIYEVGARTDDDYTTKLVVHTPDNMTGIYKFNVAIYCKGDGVASGGISMLEINTRGGDDSYVTDPSSIYVAGYGDVLGPLIAADEGKIILATITIWASGENYCTADITGVVSSIPGVEPEP